MDFKDFAVRIAPAYCGVHPSWGKVIELIIDAEEKGDPAFSSHVFTDPRERAKMLMPYGLEADSVPYNEILDLYEYAICRHRQESHGEDYEERIGILSKSLKTSDPGFLEGEEPEAVVQGWWNQ